MLLSDAILSETEATTVGDLKSRLHCHVVIWKGCTPRIYSRRFVQDRMSPRDSPDTRMPRAVRRYV